MYTSACFDFCTCSTNTFFITFCVSFFIFFCFFAVLFSNLLHSHILIQFFTIRAFPIYKINYNYIYSWLLQHNPCTHESATPLLFWPGPLPLFRIFFLWQRMRNKNVARNISCINCVPSCIFCLFPLVTVLLYRLHDWINLHH